MTAKTHSATGGNGGPKSKLKKESAKLFSKLKGWMFSGAIESKVKMVLKMMVTTVSCFPKSPKVEKRTKTSNIGQDGKPNKR